MDNKAMMRFAVFASGKGSNFCAIMKAVSSGKLNIDVGLLVCDNPGAGVVRRAIEFKVPVALVCREDFRDKEAFGAAIIDTLRAHRIHAVALAGFMRILGPEVIRAYRNRIINIHPALLPSFKGAHAIRDAFEYGVRVSGVTVHFVDEKVDHGPVILQEAVVIGAGDTMRTLEARIHAVEHRLYPQALKLFSQGKLRVKGRRVARG